MGFDHAVHEHLSSAELRLRPALLLAFCCAACSFKTQPLFEPRDGGIGHVQGGTTADAQASRDTAILDEDSGAFDASTAPDAATNTSDAMPPGDTGAGVCTPGEVASCMDNKASVCAADGSGYEPADCKYGCSRLAANGCNQCPPSITACIGPVVLVRCDEDGKPHPETCAMGCMGEACLKCTPGARSCRGKQLTVCSPDGQTETTVECQNGCNTNEDCMPQTLLPSHLSSMTCREPGMQDREFTQAAELDTDAECSEVVMQGPGLPEICVMKFRELRVRDGVAVQAKGSRALALIATGPMRIDGTISVSARAAVPGPGSAQGEAGVGRDAIGRSLVDNSLIELPAQAGGGGGGYSTRGARGGGAAGECGQGLLCAESGLGGAIYGNEEISPLQGGSAGGNNSAGEGSSRRGQVGAGGGALQIVACSQLDLGPHAILAANGGGGGGGNPGSVASTSDTPGAGTGGGSGGAVLIQALSIKVKAGALLLANGGGGGGGATRSGVGTAVFVAGGAGQDGQMSLDPALGGNGAGNSQPGGIGGTTQRPTAGGSVMMMFGQAAGGGGGSAGRIRLDTAPGAADAAMLVASPAMTVGVAAFD